METANRPWPNIWGDGALFAFSGIDGDTDTMSGFVGNCGRDPGSLHFHLLDCSLDWPASAPANVTLAVNDSFDLRVGTERRAAAYSAWHTITGVCPAAAQPTLRSRNGNVCGAADDCSFTAVGTAGAAVALAVRGARFGLAFGAGPEQACRRARHGLAAAVDDLIAARQRSYASVPSLAAPNLTRLLLKCFSVMRVNTCAPEGVFSCRWSTPDRFPHRWLWLWDSAFHAVAMARFDADLAWDQVAAVFSAQGADGFLPHCTLPTGETSAITQPPLLAWATLEVHQVAPKRARLLELLPRLESYLDWDLEHRDRNGNGIPEWEIGGDPHCRSGESGLDNSPRFDTESELDAVDFASLLAHDMSCLAGLQEAAGDLERAALWSQKSRDLQDRIQRLLWDPAQNGYRDRCFDGRFSTVAAVSNLFPLLLDSTPADRVAALTARIRDPAGYATALPLPSVARDDPNWGFDMWRGPAWLNTTYLVLLGLRRHGQGPLAAALAASLLAGVRQWYETEGVLYEYYDAANSRSPSSLDRKGPKTGAYGSGPGMQVIRDYHWAAAVTALLLLENWSDT